LGGVNPQLTGACQRIAEEMSSSLHLNKITGVYPGIRHAIQCKVVKQGWEDTQTFSFQDLPGPPLLLPRPSGSRSPLLTFPTIPNSFAPRNKVGSLHILQEKMTSFN
jgi:hypothetical protein